MGNMHVHDLDGARNGESGIITDIQRFSVHDGPGIRTIVFSKGCPLRCKWCQNPETFQRNPEVILEVDNCIGCGKCVISCPEKLISVSDEGELETNRNACTACGVCCGECCTKARRIVGKAQTVEEVLAIVRRDMVFYKTSGGGLTLSGGEILAQAGFALELLKRAKEEGIHTAIETSGYGRWEDLEYILKYTDLVLFDIKHLDPEKHKQYTGVGNELIQKNLRRTREVTANIIARLPMIPQVNDDVNTVHQVGVTLRDLDIKEAHILPFHQSGELKWLSLDMDYPFEGWQGLTAEDVLSAKDILEYYGISVSIGGSGK